MPIADSPLEPEDMPNDKELAPDALAEAPKEIPLTSLEEAELPKAIELDADALLLLPIMIEELLFTGTIWPEEVNEKRCAPLV
jgi:hypothetical protein